MEPQTIAQSVIPSDRDERVNLKPSQIFEDFGSKIVFVGSESVSYTHLDVYKRQTESNSAFQEVPVVALLVSRRGHGMFSGAIMNGRTSSEPHSVRFHWYGVAIICVLGMQAFAQSNSLAPDDVDRRVQSIIDKMTIEEKIDLLGGEDNMYTVSYTHLDVYKRQI